MTGPGWFLIAKGDIGLREIAGAPTAPKIAAWLQSLGAWWRDDETPWCGVAVAGWMQSCGVSVPKHWYRAKGWLDWGVPLSRPELGAVVVFERAGGGHVGLVAGSDRNGRLLVLGGNQGNAVSIAPFDISRVIGYRWPANREASRTGMLPKIAHAGASSTNEA
jgi:uncharacterized protein (TIGR02594 family)